MKKLIFSVFAVFSFVFASAQTVSTDVKIGDTFVISSPESSDFEHINFPQNNFIIKRGGIANIRNVVGSTVEITDLKENKQGETEVRLQRTDGKKFYRKFPTVTANLKEALENGELVRVL